MAKSSRLPVWASARKPTPFVVAIDDSGQKAVRPSDSRRCFFLGGLILPLANLEMLRNTWLSQGQEEIKAKTYSSTLGFDGAAHPDWSEGFLSVQMEHWNALPIWFSVDKNEAGEDITTPTRLGGRRIDTSMSMTVLAATLSTHLEHVRGSIESIVVDKMASSSDEETMQQQWATARGQLKLTHQRSLPAELTFLDSKTAPEIQVADVLMGLIRAAQEEERPMAPGLSRLLRKAQAQNLFGFHLS